MTMIVGTGIHNGQYEAWIATVGAIPEAGTFVFPLPILAILPLPWRRKR